MRAGALLAHQLTRRLVRVATLVDDVEAVDNRVICDVSEKCLQVEIDKEHTVCDVLTVGVERWRGILFVAGHSTIVLFDDTLFNALVSFGRRTSSFARLELVDFVA